MRRTAILILVANGALICLPAIALSQDAAEPAASDAPAATDGGSYAPDDNISFNSSAADFADSLGEISDASFDSASPDIADSDNAPPGVADSDDGASAAPNSLGPAREQAGDLTGGNGRADDNRNDADNRRSAASSRGTGIAAEGIGPALSDAVSKLRGVVGYKVVCRTAKRACQTRLDRQVAPGTSCQCGRSGPVGRVE